MTPSTLIAFSPNYIELKLANKSNSNPSISILEKIEEQIGLYIQSISLEQNQNQNGTNDHLQPIQSDTNVPTSSSPNSFPNGMG